MSSRRHSEEIYQLLDDQREQLSHIYSTERNILRDSIHITRCPLGYTFTSSTVQPHNLEPERLHQSADLQSYLSLPPGGFSRSSKLCQIISLRRENTGAPLSVTKRLLDDMTDICPSRWELRTLLGRQVKGIGASDFPNTDFASTVYRSLSDHIDKRLDLGLGCTGFECMYGFASLDPHMRAAVRQQDDAGNEYELEADWAVRRSFIYHYHVQNKELSRSYSLFILVAAQKHVERSLVEFFRRTGAGVGGNDPFNAHVALHHYCLGSWPIQIDRISKELHQNYNKLIIRGLDRGRTPQSQPLTVETWFKECKTTIELSDRLDVALGAAKAAELLLTALMQYRSKFRDKQVTESVSAGRDPIEGLLLEHIDFSKSMRSQLATLQTKAERIASIYARFSQIQVEQYNSFTYSLEVQRDAVEKQTKNSTEIARTLTFLGALFLPANLLSNIVGISKENVDTGNNWGYWMIGVFAGPFLLYGLITLYVSVRARRQKIKDEKSKTNDEEQQARGSKRGSSYLEIFSKDLW